VYWVVLLAFLVLTIAGLWKTFAKAKKPGWAAIVPIYNIIVLLEVINRPLWWIILLFIPIVNIIMTLVIALDLAKAFGKSALFGVVAIWIFNPIGYLMLGFGSAKYKGLPKR
jgi:hypothetical protein